MKKFFLLFLILFSSYVQGSIFDTTKEIPVAYKGRFRPLDSTSKLWLYELSHQQKVNGLSSLEVLWDIHFLGHSPWDNTPLFWVHLASVKSLLGLEINRSLFSYNELKHMLLMSFDDQNPHQADPLAKEELITLSAHLNDYLHYEGSELQSESAFQETYKQLQQQYLSSHHKALVLESQHPLSNRLSQTGSTIIALPGHFLNGEWFSLKALKVKVYDADQDQLIPIRNFTLFSDEKFEKIRSLYLDIENSLKHSHRDQEKLVSLFNKLTTELEEGYAFLADTPYKEAAGKKLFYPSLTQIQAEQFYYEYPLIEICILLYILAFCFFILKYKPFYFSAFVFMSMAFAIHTFVLALRCFILQRPPVSNMFETIIYVPWIAVLSSFFLSFIFRNTFSLIASSFIAVALLVLLKLTHVNSHLENVQAVLDSQYWLIIHVLMVVGSYGIFILSGIIGHFYLIGFVKNKGETPSLHFLGKLILHSMYLGTALLIPGTILGGVWAAESWGRFWDWDPKESWAFISICIYLIVIHSYTFHQIRTFGLAVGAIGGLLAISFTWYGVNYILGTGLHSYGFGSGGEFYYYLYFLGEVIFLCGVFFACLSFKRQIMTR